MRTRSPILAEIGGISEPQLRGFMFGLSRVQEGGTRVHGLVVGYIMVHHGTIAPSGERVHTQEAQNLVRHPCYICHTAGSLVLHGSTLSQAVGSLPLLLCQILLKKSFQQV